ncbi:MAG TPA: hypothetical protein VM580_02350, partial [Labilithrix sp.]|nr:hypothetical protein [Labilithrix sp.]
LATHGLFTAQAYAVVNGGPMGVPAATRKGAPMLLVSGSSSQEQQQKATSLHDSLKVAGWAHAFCSRAGGTTLLPDDVEAALRFFQQDADGTLKPQNGAYSCGNEPLEPKRAGAGRK